MRLRTAIVVFALALIAGLAVWKWTQRAAPEPTRQPFLELAADSLSRIAVTGPAGNWELARVGDQWRFAEPFRAEVRKDVGPALVSQLTSIADLGLVDGTAASLGLSSPRCRLRFESAVGSPVELELGVDLPASQGVAARRAGDDRIHAIPHHVLELASQRASDLRERSIAADLAERAERIEVRPLGAPPYAFVRTETGWYVELPGIGRDFAEPKLVLEMKKALVDLTVVTFDGPAGDETPPGWTQLRLIAGPRVLTLDIEPARGAAGPPMGRRRVRFDGEQGTAAVVWVESAMRFPRALAIAGERFVHPIAIHVRSRSGTVRLTHDGQTWRSDGGRQLAAELIDGAVDKLLRGRGIGFLEPELGRLAGIPTDASAFRITLVDGAGQEFEFTIHPGRNAEGAVWDHRRPHPVVLQPKRFLPIGNAWAQVLKAAAGGNFSP